MSAPKELAEPVTCPGCGMSWDTLARNAWWLTFDRCWACQQHTLGVQRVLCPPEAQQFALAGIVLPDRCGCPDCWERRAAHPDAALQLVLL